MKVLRTMVSLVAAVAIAAPMAASQVENSDFAVMLPEGYSEFMRQVQKVKAPSGEIEQVTYVSKAADGSAFIVTFGDLSGPITDPEAAMDGGRDSLVKSLNAAIERESAMQIDGLPGRSFEFSSQGQTPIFARTAFAVTGPRMYQVIFLGYSPEARANPNVQSFFDSFDVRYEAEAVEPVAPDAPPLAEAQPDVAAPTPNS